MDPEGLGQGVSGGQAHCPLLTMLEAIEGGEAQSGVVRKLSCTQVLLGPKAPHVCSEYRE